MKKENSKKKGSKSIYLKTYLFGLGLSFIFFPFFAYAATTYSQDLFGLFEYAKDIINDLVLWLIVTGSVMLFVYRLVKFLWTGSESAAKRKEALQYIMYGLIALTLMFTFYAVVGLIAVTFGIQIGIPQFFKTQDGLSPGSGNVQKSYSVIGN
jgi:hypothetical protein